MKFNSTAELINYVQVIGEERLQKFDITFTPINEGDVPYAETKAVCVVPLEESVGIASLSDSPTVKAGLDETLEENVLYADSFDSIPFSCSTGKVSLLGRTVFMNVCEADETGPVVHLSLVINEKSYHNVPFKLKKTQDRKSDYIMQLNPNTLSNE